MVSRHMTQSVMEAPTYSPSSRTSVSAGRPTGRPCSPPETIAPCGSSPCEPALATTLASQGDLLTSRLCCRPTELLDMTLPTRNISPPLNLKPTLVLPQQSAIYSSLWYPTASLSTEGTFCFLVAGEGVPIRLIDGVDGRVSRDRRHLLLVVRSTY